MPFKIKLFRTRSVIKSTANGMLKARNLFLYIAPLNKAKAPKAVKLGGCGKKRVRATIDIAMLMNQIFFIFNVLVLYFKTTCFW